MQGKTLTAKRDLSLTECENLLQKLNDQRDIILRWPTAAKHAPFGGEPMAVLCLATWAVKSPKRELEVYFESEERAVDFVKTLSGLAAFLTSKKVTFEKSKEALPRTLVIALDQLSQLDSQQSWKHLKGPTVLAMCADHVGFSFPASLYDLAPSGPTIKSSAGFEALIYSFIHRVIGQKHLHDPRFFESTATILRELVLNTDQHATKDIDGRDLDVSIRGFFAKIHRVTDQSAGTISKDSPAIAAFLSALLPRRTSRSLQLLELSVFDTGPGFAPTLLGKRFYDISREDEEQAVEDCFTKHLSAKRAPHKGNGLNLVSELLRRNHGFLQVRTGRVSRYLNAHSIEQLSRSALRSTLSRGDNARPLAEVRGSSVTVLLPLGVR